MRRGRVTAEEDEMSWIEKFTTLLAGGKEMISKAQSARYRGTRGTGDPLKVDQSLLKFRAKTDKSTLPRRSRVLVLVLILAGEGPS